MVTKKKFLKEFDGQELLSIRFASGLIVDKDKGLISRGKVIKSKDKLTKKDIEILMDEFFEQEFGFHPSNKKRLKELI